MFYKTGVDISNVKSMWEFLHDHFTYPTMNSWNGVTSIANNVKLYKLGLEGDYCNILRFLNDPIDQSGLSSSICETIKEFEEANPGYKVGFNGRSDGYLVLYNAANYNSILPDFITDYDSYEDFKQDQKRLFLGAFVNTYKQELRDLTELVRGFDKLCDKLRDIVNWYSKLDYERVILAAAVDHFRNSYEDDLMVLNLQGPTYVEGGIHLGDIGKFAAFLDCLLYCFAPEDRQKLTFKNGLLCLEKDV